MSTLVENLNLQYGMLRMLREQAKNVELLGGTRVEGIERETGVGGAGEWPVVRVTGGKGLRAKLVVRITPFLHLRLQQRQNRTRRADLSPPFSLRSEPTVFVLPSENSQASNPTDTPTTPTPSSRS